MSSERTLAKIRQVAWNAVHKDYKDDPECCFALGFDAGYDAVAQKVEPPVKESGGGFESLPASPVAWGVDEGEDSCIDLHDLYFVQSDAQHMAELKGPHAKAIPLYAAPPIKVQDGYNSAKAEEKGMNEPVAYINVEERKLEWATPIKWETPTVVKMDKVPLYPAPPQRKWRGLTYADLYFWGGELGLGELGKGVLRAVDAHLREKNQ